MIFFLIHSDRITVDILHPDGTEAAPNELGRVAVKLPLPPGNMSTLYKNDELFEKTYFKKFPVTTSQNAVIWFMLNRLFVVIFTGLLRYHGCWLQGWKRLRVHHITWWWYYQCSRPSNLNNGFGRRCAKAPRCGWCSSFWRSRANKGWSASLPIHFEGWHRKSHHQNWRGAYQNHSRSDWTHRIVPIGCSSRCIATHSLR